jgi:type IV pilus assembly protein PilV
VRPRLCDGSHVGHTGGLPMRRMIARGFSLIEVLVTLVILVFGLLGLVGLQARGTQIEFEAYQRGQAVGLVNEMAGRLASARGQVGELNGVTVSSTDGSQYFGVGSDACAGAPTGVLGQVCQSWHEALLGAAATTGGSNVGAMIGARGCLMRAADPPANGSLADVFVVVVWQGMSDGVDPVAGSPAALCASDVDFGAGRRRGVSLRVMVPTLVNT